MFGATRNYVTNRFLPGVVPANLSLPKSFDAALYSGVLSRVLRRFCSYHSERRFLAATSGSELSAANVLLFLLQTLTIPSGLCRAQYSAVFVPATPNDGILPQPSVLHLLLQMSTIPSGACCV